MGKADTVTKAYMRKNEVFADAFNYLIYGGRMCIDPAQLQEVDTTEIALPFGSQDEAAYILLGIENQTDIHYAMPVRNMIYDALQYGRQVADIATKHRKHRCTRGTNKIK